MVQLQKTHSGIALFLLRISLGLLMLTHGYPKLLKLFSGGEIMFADPIGLGMTFSLVLAVFSEFFCSILLVIGFKARWASLPLIATMAVAAFIVHGSDPLMKKELALMYLVGYLVIFIGGSGKWACKE